MNQFKPRSEGDSDYSGLVVTFLKSIIARQEGGGDRGRGRNRSRSRDRSYSHSREPRGRGRRDESPLSAFRSRYPMAEKGWQILTGASKDVRETVMADFRPKREGESDYTGLVIAFVNAVRKRFGESGGKDRHRSRDRSPSRSRSRSDSPRRDNRDKRDNDDKASAEAPKGDPQPPADEQPQPPGEP